MLEGCGYLNNRGHLCSFVTGAKYVLFVKANVDLRSKLLSIHHPYLTNLQFLLPLVNVILAKEIVIGLL